ncbi:hypothetical protein V502_02060, partial [Pseudogymnoascus sp. VKM F-4520 (FW-2644)]
AAPECSTTLTPAGLKPAGLTPQRSYAPNAPTPAGLMPHYALAPHTPLAPTALTTSHGLESAAPKIAIVVGPYGSVRPRGLRAQEGVSLAMA